MTTYTPPKNSDRVTVCDSCLKATSWYGEFLCEEARTAGTKVMFVGELKKLGLEHESHWSDEKLTRVCGGRP